MIIVLFFCSGAAALVYEVVWSRYLSLMFGSTIYAQTVVLAVFMGGLALGNRLIGARSDLLKKPLAAYGLLEMAIGLYAFCFSWIYHQADRLYVAVGSHLIGHAGWLLLWKGVVSVGLLSVPTILMGGTLPLLSAWLQKGSSDAGRWSARFYSINSLGAVLGAWLGGFFLVRSLGMASTLEMTGFANVIIGLLALGLARRSSSELTLQPKPVSASVTGLSSKLGAMRWLGMLVALTGGISMGLEVLASRSLTLIFGASLQAFAIVLMAFILGIGIGGATAASPRLKHWRSEALIFGLLLSAAVFIGVLVLGIEQWVDAYRHVRTGLARTVMGYRFHQMIAAVFSMAILGVPAALIGAVLPLCLRLVSEAGEGFGRRAGQLLTWNTLGAVGGVLLTGFVLMPNAGLRNSFNVLAMALCAPVILLALRAKRPVFSRGAILIAVALGSSCLLGGDTWRQVLSSGVFRARETYVDPRTLEERKKHNKLLFYRDGPDATVSVETPDGIASPVEIGLRISGKPEASTGLDMGTQLLLAHLPMLARPESKDVFVLGLASGITCGGLLAHPIEHLVVAENCAPVLQAVKFFARWNRGVATNPVTRIWLEDARTVLKLSDQKYDVIVSEPSNPWFANIGSVFTRDFYELAASRLKPGGIMAQWFHVYEMHDGIVGVVLRTLGTVFPQMEIWDIGGGDIVLLASNGPWDCSLESWRKTYEREGVRQDLASIGYRTPEALLARQLASQRTAFAIPGPGAIQSDEFPVLEYAAPQAFYIGAAAAQILRFDERTWQYALAPEPKRVALSNLSLVTLREAFTNASVNLDLQRAVAPKLQTTAPTGRPPETPPLGMPCLFEPGGRASEFEGLPNASEEWKRLLRASAALRTGSGDWLEQIQVIRQILLTRLASNLEKQADWSGGYFATDAARACVVRHNFTLAREMITIGGRFPDSEPELGYVARILERESAGKGE